MQSQERCFMQIELFQGCSFLLNPLTRCCVHGHWSVGLMAVPGSSSWLWMQGSNPAKLWITAWWDGLGASQGLLNTLLISGMVFLLWSSCRDGRGKPGIKTCWDQAAHSSTESPFLSTRFCFSKWAHSLISASSGVAWASVGAWDKSCSGGWHLLPAAIQTTPLFSPSAPQPGCCSPNPSTETIPSLRCPLTCFHGKERALIPWCVISPPGIVLERAFPGMWQPPPCPEELSLDRASSEFNSTLFLGLAQQLCFEGKGAPEKGDKSRLCMQSTQNPLWNKSSA